MPYRGLGNQWLVLLKDTALVYLIGINELMLQTQSIARRTEEPFTGWHRGAYLPRHHAGQSVHPQTYRTAYRTF